MISALCLPDAPAPVARERRLISAALRADRVVDANLVEYAQVGCRHSLRQAVIAARELVAALEQESKRKGIRA